MPKLADIPQFSHDGRYGADVPWNYLEEWIAHHEKRNGGIDLAPDFQRGHVWSDEQRSRYIEFVLRGGQSSRTLYWNAPGFMRTRKPKDQDIADTILLVDGTQRLESVRRFMRNELAAFGYRLNDWEDADRFVRGMSGPSFRMAINDLSTRQAVLAWYLDLNAGGTPHSLEELQRVSALLKAATGKAAA